MRFRKLLRMKKGKAAGPTGIVSEMFMANKDCSVDWMTSLCNLIAGQERIPDDWKSSILLPVFKGKGDPMECHHHHRDICNAPITVKKRTQVLHMLH